MSKQHKGPERAPTRPARDGGRAAESALSEESALGNAAVQSQLGPGLDVAGAGAATGETGLDVVRDVAFPLVERAMLALQIQPRDPAQVERFLDVLGRTHLPEDQKSVLMDRLLGNQEMALGIRASLERWFGGDDDDLRGELSSALEGVWNGLLYGRGDGDVWWLPVGDGVALSQAALVGPVGERAEAMVGDLAGTVAPDAVRERAGGEVGPAVTGYCRSIALTFSLEEDEEEEEAEAGGYGLEG